MATDLFASFDEQYMNINTKLKKRFMRKPNISEATNEFIALAIQCEHSEQPIFAGHAYIGAAKCEATAGNAFGEAEYYITAARQFMKAEKKLLSLKFSSPDRENLEAAIGCYLQALTKYPEKSLLRTSILMEIADHLVALNHKCEAVAYYQQALEDIDEKTMKIVHMKNLVNLLIECDKFEEALDTANSLVDSFTSIPEDVLAEVQISRVLLTLLVEPPEESKPESLKQLFTAIMNDCETDMFPVNPDLRLKLQSVTLSVTSRDLSSLVTAAVDTKPALSRQQADLVDSLIRS
ncbi:40-kDa huntingtin-associated protein [Amyelois transitella]|uniref:40-kDa huntingtin-associated protein n=1 Tax=Amyelois transitella TaxID=680683 RepID=UPI002990124E|nr:40-kDa huntingtin-associated protein [Amyelois transitella]